MKNLILLLVLVLVYCPLQSQEIEKLLEQGEVEKAINYSEEQEGSFKSDCYFSIAEYYLDNGDYSNAEGYFNTSGKIKEGNLKIAEFLMKGEIIDSVLKIDSRKAKSYLEKVYDNEKDVNSKMAISFEDFGIANKKTFEMFKKLKKSGLIAMTIKGKSVDIEKAYIISRLKANFYFDEAIRFYEKLGNIEKVMELKKETESLKNELTDSNKSTH